MDYVELVAIVAKYVFLGVMAVVLFVAVAMVGGVVAVRSVIRTAEFVSDNRRRIAKSIAWGLVAAFIGFEWTWFWRPGKDMPDVADLVHYAPPQIGYVYDRHDNIIIELANTFRKPVDYRDVPVVMEYATVAAEDKNFYDHDGIPGPVGAPASLRPGLWWRWLNHKGGSTLTMQLVRNHYLADMRAQEHGAVLLVSTPLTRWLSEHLGVSKTNTVVRKMAEIRMALHLEKELALRTGSKSAAKRMLLARYLSTVYYGYSMYGPDSATRFYFNKPMADLTVDEAALLASFVPAPSKYALLENIPEVRALQKARRDAVIRRMGEKQFIYTAFDCTPTFGTWWEWDRSIPGLWRTLQTGPVRADCRDDVAFYTSQPITLIGRIPGGRSEAPASVQMALDEVEDRGFADTLLFNGDVRIHTTNDLRIQRIVNRAANDGLKNYRRLFPGNPEQPFRAPQVAVIVMRNDGGVLAQFGGFNGRDRNDWTLLDRSRKSWRQLGSAFKPFVYLTAFRTGPYTPDSIVVDAPITINMGWGNRKEIHNYDNEYHGAMPFWDAFAQSRNVPAMRVGIQFTTIKDVLSTCRMAGFTTPLKNEPSTALSAGDVTLIEATNAIRFIISGGVALDPYIIDHVTDPFGNVLEKHKERIIRVDVPQQAIRYTQMLMRGTVRLPRGTGHALDSPKFGIPLLCKTGTSNDFADARMECGTFGPNGITVGVWFGHDEDRSSLGKGAAGATLALPVIRAIFSEMYDQKVGILGPAPKVPADIEDAVSAHIAGVPVPHVEPQP